MNVDFNNLRVQAAKSYNQLCNFLNGCMEEDGHLDIFANDIDANMKDLRNTIIGICSVYVEGDENFKSVLDEIGNFSVFNPNEL